MTRVCIYPLCNCPFDHPGTEGWCARGLPQQAPRETPLNAQVNVPERSFEVQTNGDEPGCENALNSMNRPEQGHERGGTDQ